MLHSSDGSSKKESSSILPGRGWSSSAIWISQVQSLLPQNLPQLDPSNWMSCFGWVQFQLPFVQPVQLLPAFPRRDLKHRIFLVGWFGSTHIFLVGLVVTATQNEWLHYTQWTAAWQITHSGRERGRGSSLMETKLRKLTQEIMDWESQKEVIRIWGQHNS